jgi:dolichol-phosphate mannosyltransferase
MPARLGVVVPTFKEQENVAALLAAVAKAAPGCAVVVVDDSPDSATADAARATGKAAVVARGKKLGRGSAAREGLKLLLEKGCAPIVELDADFSHPPEQIPALAAELESKGLDLLIASRYVPGSRIENWPLGRRWFSLFANCVARAALGVPVRDYTNGFRCYSRRAAELVAASCGKKGDGFIALSEILVNLNRAGFAIGETPTVFVNRRRGESSLSLREVLGAAAGLLRLIGP